ncbi:hypothetical protein [Chryseobacterium sp. W4I1]|uniref:hypothetical protein n=1 Tax=Chryseobacterium sp. W4I1 TaxID=3042293 RepID=UPI0027D90293|nr:hypothetical protein [Chryseobacterium sp. W4I1]
MDSYTNQMDYQGKADQEILDEILSRSSLENFQAKIKVQKLLIDEQNRVIREIHGHYMNSRSKEECLTLITSDLLPSESIKFLIEKKYIQIHQNVENLKVDSDTLMYSIFGTIVASVASSIIILVVIYSFPFLSVFAFNLLIPVYIINYWIIRLFMGKTRANLAVFIASFVATVLNCLYFFFFIT